MHIKQLVLARHDHVFAVFLDCRPSRFNSGGHEMGCIMTQLLQFALEASADFIDGATRIILINEIGCFRQFSLAVCSVRKKHSVLHIPFRRHDNEQNALFRQGHEFDIAKYSRTTLGRHHHPGKACQFRQQLGSRVNQS